MAQLALFQRFVKAVREGHCDAAVTCLDEGLEAATAQDGGSGASSPLQVAVLEGADVVVRRLLAMHVPVDGSEVDTELQAPLLLATRNACSEQADAAVCGRRIMRDLLAAGAPPNGLPPAGEAGFGTLHLAVRMGSTAVVKLLLEAGADAHLATLAGATPCSLAVTYGRVERLLQLLHSGQAPDCDALRAAQLPQYGTAEDMSLAQLQCVAVLLAACDGRVAPEARRLGWRPPVPVDPARRLLRLDRLTPPAGTAFENVLVVQGMDAGVLLRRVAACTGLLSGRRFGALHNGRTAEVDVALTATLRVLARLHAAGSCPAFGELALHIAGSGGWGPRRAMLLSRTAWRVVIRAGRASRAAAAAAEQ